MGNFNNISIINALCKRLEDHNDNRIAVQEELHSICTQLKKDIDDMENKINAKFQVVFENEDHRLQGLLGDIYRMFNECESNSKKAEGEVNELFERIKGDLFVTQNYSLIKTENSTQKYDINVTKDVSSDLLFEKNLEKIEDVEITSITDKSITLKFKSPITDFETESIKENNLLDEIKYKVEMRETTESGEDITAEYILDNTSNTFYPESIKINAHYTLRIRAEVKDIWKSKWSDPVDFTPLFSNICSWKECPKKVSPERKYTLNDTNTRIATKTSGSGCWTTVLGSVAVPPNSVVSWDVKILESRRNNGSCIMIGVAPPEIDQNSDRNFEKTGRYFNCFESTLFFGSPCCFKGKEYGPRKDIGQYVHTGDTVSVIMDTKKGELSFAVNGVNLGVAFNDIPLDKPLLPCVILGQKNDSVELSI